VCKRHFLFSLIISLVTAPSQTSGAVKWKIKQISLGEFCFLPYSLNILPASRITNWFKACFHSRIGIVYFFELFLNAK